MRATILAAVALTAAGATVDAFAAKPQRVMTLMQCADQLVLSLLPRERIASITYLSAPEQSSYFAAEATGVHINYGTAEEVLTLKPDLVIAGSYTTPTTRQLLKKLGSPLLEIPPANTFEDIRTITRLVAHTVGEEEKGEALLAEMDATLAELKATRPAKPIVIAAWSGGGSVPGQGTLVHEIFTAAGAINVAATLPDTRYGSFDLEQLLAANPDVLAYGSTATSKPALRTESLQHPVIARHYQNRQITYPEDLYSCGVPQTAQAVRQLREALLAIAP